MRTSPTRTTLAMFVLAVASLAAASPQLGTWKLNEAKSKAVGVQRNNVVVYSESGGNVTVAIDGVDANGTAFHSEWTGKFDGKEYPVTGDPTSDARAYTLVDANTLSFHSAKGGKTTLTGTIIVAPDGKSRTVNTSATNDKGEKVSQTTVYDKQ